MVESKSTSTFKEFPDANLDSEQEFNSTIDITALDARTKDTTGTIANVDSVLQRKDLSVTELNETGFSISNALDLNNTEDDISEQLVIDNICENPGQETAEENALTFIVVSTEDSPLIQHLLDLEIPNLIFLLNPETFATDKEFLKSDVLLLDLNSESTYSIGQVCQRFEDIPVLALLPNSYSGEIKQLFQQGICDYIYQKDISASYLQNFAEKTKFRFDVNKDRQATILLSTQERAQKEYSSQLQDIVASSPMIACKWTSPDGYELRFKYISENISQFGYSAEEIVSGAVKWPDVVHPDDVENNRVQLFTATIDGSDEVEFQYRIITRDGEERWLETHTMLERRENGMVRYYQGFILDITERKRAEALKDEKNKEIALLGKIQSAISSCHSVGELYDFVTAAISDILGYKHVLITQYHDRQLIAVSNCGYNVIPDTAELIDSPISKAIRRARPLLFNATELSQYGQLSSDVTSSMVIPFFDSEEVVGAMMVESKEAILSEDDLSLMIKVGIQVNLSIENLRLQEKNKYDLVRAEALYEVSQTLTESRTVKDVMNSVTDTILSALSARWILSYKVNHKTQEIETAVSASEKDSPLETLMYDDYRNSLACWAMKHKRPIMIAAKSDDPRESESSKALRLANNVGSMIVIPIIYNNRVLGAVSALNSMTDPDFTQDDANLMTAFVNQVAVAIDQRELMSKIEHQAFHDALTELPNRSLFHDRLTKSIAQAQRYKSKLSLLFFDLDGFKTINDTLGHHVGDSLLVGIAERFSKRIRDCDTLARMGGDEFAIILNDIHDRENAISVAGDFLSLLEEPFYLQDHVVTVSASIGVSLFPEDGGDVATLLKYSDIAMYLAKDSGKNDVQSFTPELAEQVHERMTLESELRTALDNEEFILHYQPQIDINTGERIGLEALVRWMHPVKGLVPPPKFIPATEETLLVVPIGKWILREACRQSVAWQKQGKPPVLMAVNVSMQQFTQPDFVEIVQEALNDTGLDPQYLELEVTEGVVMRNVEHVAKQLTELRSLGVKIALDDFGTGFSSLQYLQTLPFDKLKIDRTFIMNLEEDKTQRALVKAIITFAKSFELETIAEGVETIEQLEILRDLGCQQAQGFYYDRPLEAQKAWKKK